MYRRKLEGYWTCVEFSFSMTIGRNVTCLEQAVDIIEHDRIAVVLADMAMIGRAGTKLGTFAAARGIKVLMMQAGDDVTFRAEAAGLRYIVKPFGMAEIVETVSPIVPSA